LFLINLATKNEVKSLSIKFAYSNIKANYICVELGIKVIEHDEPKEKK